MIYRVREFQQGKYQAFVDWKIGDKRQRKFFESAKKAKAWADKKNGEAKNSGINAVVMPEELRVEAQQAAFLLEPFGRTITEAVRFAISHWKASDASRKVSAAVADLVAHKEAKRAKGVRGGSERYCGDLKFRLAKFSDQFGERRICEIAKSEIREWLDKLPGGPVNRNNTQRVLSVLWEFSVRKEWCERNIVREIDRDDVPKSKIGILTVEESARLLVAAPERFKSHLAIALFCGLRRTEAERLKPTSVNLKAGLIEASVTKTAGASRRFIKIRRNLRAWLLAFGPPKPLTSQQFKVNLDSAIKAAGINPWPHNATRHSFCSYALAHDRNLQDLTLEMGHTNPHTLFAHYRELVAPEDAAAYWRLTPARARAIAIKP